MKLATISIAVALVLATVALLILKPIPSAVAHQNELRDRYLQLETRWYNYTRASSEDLAVKNALISDLRSFQTQNTSDWGRVNLGSRVKYMISTLEDE